MRIGLDRKQRQRQPAGFEPRRPARYDGHRDRKRLQHCQLRPLGGRAKTNPEEPMKLRHALIRTAAALVAVAASAIAAAADKDDFELRAEKLRSGPKSAPIENAPGFNKGLKCMDRLFRTF